MVVSYVCILKYRQIQGSGKDLICNLTRRCELNWRIVDRIEDSIQTVLLDLGYSGLGIWKRRYYRFLWFFRIILARIA